MRRVRREGGGGREERGGRREGGGGRDEGGRREEGGGGREEGQRRVVTYLKLLRSASSAAHNVL